MRKNTTEKIEKEIIVRSKAKPGYALGRNTGNVGNIYRIYNIYKLEDSQYNYNYEKIGEYRTTSVSFNLPNGISVDYIEIPKLWFSLGMQAMPHNTLINA
ncbi:hypothetical protein IR083_20860 [Dysgonomonas sp. GY75]|uniref:hypothetical protein n=1 Tax=Dysgonomonas sp. GY75 TaxID=2780419 RepID=UPI001883326C|nr:hypothetical protein [Dysgonomonas sp. GY75]MBF0651273.1 hypothetical protein [Dysgonomonas sp. GY75]